MLLMEQQLLGALENCFLNACIFVAFALCLPRRGSGEWPSFSAPGGGGQQREREELKKIDEEEGAGKYMVVAGAEAATAAAAASFASTERETLYCTRSGFIVRLAALAGLGGFRLVSGLFNLLPRQ